MSLPSNGIGDLPFPVRIERGEARFTLDMAVLGHTDAADTSGGIGRNMTALRTLYSYANVFAPNYRLHFRIRL